jgi:rhodanese-related sulfurtransferase
LVRRIGLQFTALLVLSAALGFTFNAANPIGVRFAKAPTGSPPAVGSKTNFSLSSTSSVVVQPSPPVAQGSAQPAPQPVPQAATRPPVPPRLPPMPTNFPKPAMATTTPPPATNPAPVAVARPAQTNLNPAPVHWREAKPLVATGSALLVDVRARPVYEAGHIPDAISLPETSSSAEIAAFINLVTTNLTLILYCSSTSCSQSLRVANRLVSEFHHPSVKYMTGGYQEYQQEELAQSQPPGNPQPPAVR